MPFLQSLALKFKTQVYAAVPLKSFKGYYYHKLDNTVVATKELQLDCLLLVLNKR